MALPTNNSQNRDNGSNKKSDTENSPVNNTTSSKAKSSKTDKKKFGTSEKKLTAADIKKQRERKKKLGIAGGALALAVLLGGSGYLILNYEGADDTSDEEVVNGGNDLSGDNGGLTDGGTGTEGSTGRTDEDFPVDDLPTYSRESHNTSWNNERRQAYNDEWDEGFELPSHYEGRSVDDDDPDDLSGDVVEWNNELNRAEDPRVDSGDSEYTGYQWRAEAEDWARINIPGLSNVSMNYPSRAQGYTNNPAHQHLEDGSLNPYYSYLLQEDVEYFFGNTVQRLLNPVYGSWWHYQHGEDSTARSFDSDQFKELFTESWWEENVVNGSESNIPIYADWEGNNYGRDDLIEFGPRWFGEVQSGDFSISGDGEIEAVMQIEFTSFDEDENTITTSGVLEISAIPNDVSHNDPEFRFLISDANLSVD